MYKDLIKEQIFQTNQEPKVKRFQGIYKQDSSSSSSDDEQEKFGSKKLSYRKNQKLINYLFVEIDISR